MAIDPEVEQRIAKEVDRMAEILDKDMPPISFEEVTLLGIPAHTSFRDNTLLISPSSVRTLTFDELRTSIAYSLATLVRISKMYQRTKIAWAVGSITTITFVVLAANYKLFDLGPVIMVVCGLVLLRWREQRSWQRISETDALVYRLVGNIEPVIEYIKTKGYRPDTGGYPSHSEMVARRIAALKVLLKK